MIDVGVGVSLKTIDKESVGLLREWRNDYRVWRFCRQHDLITESEHLRWYDSLTGRRDVRMYLIVDSTDPTEYVGVCGLTDIDSTNRRAEFSLYIDPDKHRSGFGSKALWTLLSHGFMNLGLNTIWGETYEGNPALTMFERIGMKREGTRRQFYFREGRFIDAHLVSILASEFLRGSFDRTRHRSEKERTPGIVVPSGVPLPFTHPLYDAREAEEEACRKRRRKALEAGK